MSAFRAFTFVNSIEPSSFEPGISVRAKHAIPSTLADFPMSLAAEAVGQAAAWSAMAKLDFRVRPVAGLAGRVTLLGEVKPGDVLELSATIESAEEDAVAYHGHARVNGVEVIRLEDCVGPMLPQEDFDDPAELGRRLEILLTSGREPGGFQGTPVFSSDPRDEEGTFVASLEVPALDHPAAAFFTDHFPRNPVFPGTLLTHENFRLAVALASAKLGGAWRVDRVEDVKLRSFIKPGELLSLHASLLEDEDAEADTVTVEVKTKNTKRAIGGARVVLRR